MKASDLKVWTVGLSCCQVNGTEALTPASNEGRQQCTKK